MPRQRTEYLALLSSPSGLDADRQAVRNAVEEVNSNIQHENVGIYLRDWKSDVAPGATDDTQMKINQIVDSVDVVIAILHTRAGQPTARFRSGTIEEVERILDRRKKGHNVEVMVYFKKEKVDPDDIDLDQLAAVRAFRDQVRSQVLYAEYSDLTELSRNIRTSLPAVIRGLAGGEQTERTGYSDALEPAVVGFWAEDETDDEVEEGALEIQDRFTEVMEALTTSMEEGGSLSGTFADRLKALTPDQSALPATATVKDARIRLEQSTDAFEEFNEQMERVVAQFGANARRLPELADAQVPFLGSEISASPEDVENLANVMERTVEQLMEYRASTSALRETMTRTPRLTKRLNQAKRRSVRFLDSQLASLDTLATALPVVANRLRGRAEDLRLSGGADDNVLDAKL